MHGRNWLVAGVLIVAVIAAATLAGHSKPRISGPHAVVAFGLRVPVGRLPSRTGLRLTNGWSASSATNFVGVYAGAQTSHPDNGLLVIARRSRGRQHSGSVVLHATGAVTLLKPAAAASESAADHAILRFVTASGASGALNVGTGKVSLHA
jgi:hypothetical protein